MSIECTSRNDAQFWKHGDEGVGAAEADDATVGGGGRLSKVWLVVGGLKITSHEHPAEYYQFLIKHWRKVGRVRFRSREVSNRFSRSIVWVDQGGSAL
jgi:hypothetical protein